MLRTLPLHLMSDWVSRGFPHQRLLTFEKAVFLRGNQVIPLVVLLFMLVDKFIVSVQSKHWVFKAQKCFYSFMHNCTMWSSLPYPMLLLVYCYWNHCCCYCQNSCPIAWTRVHIALLALALALAQEHFSFSCIFIVDKLMAAVWHDVSWKEICTIYIETCWSKKFTLGFKEVAQEGTVAHVLLPPRLKFEKYQFK